MVSGEGASNNVVELVVEKQKIDKKEGKKTVLEHKKGTYVGEKRYMCFPIVNKNRDKRNKKDHLVVKYDWYHLQKHLLL